MRCAVTFTRRGKWSRVSPEVPCILLRHSLKKKVWIPYNSLSRRFLPAEAMWLLDLDVIEKNLSNRDGAVQRGQPNRGACLAVVGRCICAIGRSPDITEQQGQKTTELTGPSSSLLRIAQSSTEEHRAYFNQFGPVERVVVKHSYLEKQRSFAFVTIDGGDTKEVCVQCFCVRALWGGGRHARAASVLRASLRLRCGHACCKLR